MQAGFVDRHSAGNPAEGIPDLRFAASGMTTGPGSRQLGHPRAPGEDSYPTAGSIEPVSSWRRCQE